MENDPVTNDSARTKKTYSFMAKYAQPSQRMFGDNITNFAGQEDVLPSGSKYADDVFKTPAPAQQANDPASSGKLLAKQLGEVAKTLATPVERKVNGGRRCSILPDELELNTSILDLNGFDAQGERRRHSLSTPLIATSKQTSLNAQNGLNLASKGVATSNNSINSVVAEVAELRSQREEMMSILEGYQGTIAKMSDEYSRDACAWTSENKLLKTEVDRLRHEREQIHEQFTLLYEKKYVPLKEYAKNMEKTLSHSSREKEVEAEAEAVRQELAIMKCKWNQALDKVAEKEREIDGLTSKVVEKEREIDGLTSKVAEKEREIDGLTERLHESSMLLEKISELSARR